MSINYPVVNDGLLYSNGLCVSWLSSTTLGLSAGAARNSSNINDIVLPSDVVINVANVGPNGLDGGTIAASTWYAIYVIGDSTSYQPTAGLVSADFAAPTLPLGYDMSQFVGVVVTDGGGLLLSFTQYGEGLERTFYQTFGTSVLSGGVATTSTAVDLSAGVPPVKGEANVLVFYTPALATHIAKFSGVAGGTTIQYGPGVAALAAQNLTIPYQLAAGVPTLYYELDGGSVNLVTVGFKYSLC